jgi:hypothetical protein
MGSARSGRWSYNAKEQGWVEGALVLQGSRDKVFDLTPYDSVSFYVKGFRPGTAGFMVHARRLDDGKVSYSIIRFDYTTEFKRVTIDLQQDKLSRLDLRKVHQFNVGHLAGGTDDNVLCIDEIACHRKLPESASAPNRQ